MKMFLKSVGLGVTLTLVYLLLSFTSLTFGELRVVYRLRELVFNALVSLGMNPHQPSDEFAVPAFFLVFTVISWLLLGTIEIMGRFAKRKRADGSPDR